MKNYLARGNIYLLARSEEKLLIQEDLLEFLKKIIFFMLIITSNEKNGCYFQNNSKFFLKHLFVKDYIGSGYEGFRISIKRNDLNLLFVDQEGDCYTILKNNLSVIDILTINDINRIFISVWNLLKGKPEFDKETGFLLIPSEIEMSLVMEMKIIHNNRIFYLIF